MDQPGEFARSFKGFMDQMARQAPREEPVFVTRLTAHLGASPASLPIVTHQFEKRDHANVQLALDDWCAAEGRSAQTLGVVSPMRGFAIMGLAQLVAPAAPGMGSATIGPVEYVNIEAGEERPRVCLQSGLMLLSGPGGEAPLAVLVQGPSEHRMRTGLTVDVMAADRASAEAFLDALRASIRRRNVYRGRVVSLTMERMGDLSVRFHTLPRVRREDIVLASGVLERVERHTVGFSAHRERLLAAGSYLKRGLLLYGPPGTGKTLTAMYLAGRMPGRTVLLVTGRGQGLIEHTCAMARALQPATVILEDVDLIGTSRDDAQWCTGPLLYELLNQMDGLSEDADVLFVLTTNRPDVLEPALAARPGRVDQAVEVPLPDAACRDRLIDLYGRGVDLRLKDRQRAVARTEGASAAFIKEMMRRAALFAADKGGDLVVTDGELDEAIHELALLGGPLTRSLLGFRGAGGGAEDLAGGSP